MDEAGRVETIARIRRLANETVCIEVLEYLRWFLQQLPVLKSVTAEDMLFYVNAEIESRIK